MALKNSVLSRPAMSSAVTITCALGLLYFGRPVLEPLVLALILSLVIAPLIRVFNRWGLGFFTSTVVSLLLVGASIAAVGAVLALQLVSVTKDLPHYRAAIHGKIERIQELTERPFARLAAELNAVSPLSKGSSHTASAGLPRNATQAIPVEIRTPAPAARDTVARFISVISGPVGEAGLVFVLLVFILLEHESLRERVVRLAGQGDVSRTMRTLVHAAEGVSRFFFSQFIVNIIFALTVSLGLWLLHVPHALLWGSLSGLLRFVPYVGALVAGLAITLFVAAIDPGWTLALWCMAMFAVLEIIVANIIEPKVYGHSSGLSPLAVIVSALFWGTLWGPAGLLISTPLTLCLVVAGRHIRALEAITVLFADTPGVSEAERFYHRVLAGSSTAVIEHAQAYLRRSSFARYCDHVLLPGLDLAVDDRALGLIDQAQQDRIRSTVIALADTLARYSGDSRYGMWRRRKMSLADANIGAHLRHAREARLGTFQGSLDVPLHSVILCAGFANERDEFLTELLVLALREVCDDVRSTVLDRPRPEPVADKGGLIGTAFIMYPEPADLEQWRVLVADMRSHLPDATLVTIRHSNIVALPHQAAVEQSVDIVLRSFEEGLAFVTPEKAGAAKR
ncbi:AI-2E family transporter [Janthinobacterium psychrotolerans]|uniref:Putative PurR-regulated permease PerM n=1 Tax=Janthinobacterium psychrotolerans TaxID=1747903 RepID=A0A1A7BWV5_9BURK|nr:AI-2E family transporter [Janthinobacterium psychrotolerans]OBV37992.1 putative PurR-regulated permease PerM [Janthinobacterium psychrotolerans]